jgi:hypothetical protein
MRRNQSAARVAHLVNHIFLLVDASSSMIGLKDTTIKVFDNFVRHLAEKSQANGQETRVTIYFFSSHGELECVVWDMDVLRVPSIAGLYNPYGNTALIQAFLESVKDMRKIPQMYGDHSVVFFGFTDGEENDSARPRSWGAQDRLIRELKQTIASAPENETYGLFVPDAEGVAEAKRFGFPADNITVWDPTSVKGVEQAGLRLREVADAYMMGRSQGVRGYSASSGSGLFKMKDFSARDVQAALTPVTQGSFFFLDIEQSHRDPGSDGARLDHFYENATGHPYPKGRCYYEFTKAETVQGYKQVAILVGDTLYSGTLDETRGLLGLPSDHSVKLRPDQKPGATIFIQSTSNNRKLMPGTRLLVMR